MEFAIIENIQISLYGIMKAGSKVGMFAIKVNFLESEAYELKRKIVEKQFLEV